MLCKMWSGGTEMCGNEIAPLWCFPSITLPLYQSKHVSKDQVDGKWQQREINLIGPKSMIL